MMSSNDHKELRGLMHCKGCGRKLVFKDTEQAKWTVGWMHYSSIKLSAQLGTRISRNDLTAIATCKCGIWYVEYKKHARAMQVAKIQGHDMLYDVGRMKFVNTL